MTLMVGHLVVTQKDAVRNPIATPIGRSFCIK